MASGIQDWWRRGSIDIIAQTLAEVYSRPTYGAFGQVNSIKACSAGLNILDTVVGTGIIYGGYSRFASVAAGWQNSYWGMGIDGATSYNETLDKMSLYALDEPNASFTYLLQYSGAGGENAVGFSKHITFESSVVLTFWNGTAGVINLTTLLYYALV